MLEDHIGNVQLMQRLNRLKVLNIVRRGGRMNRATISEISGLSLSTVTNIVTYLMSVGLILDEGREPENRVGRKTAILDFNYYAYKFVCAVVTKTEISTALCALDGSVLDISHTKIKNAGNLERLLLNQLSDMLERHYAEKIPAVGVAMSAMVSDGGNTVFSSTLGLNLNGLCDRLSESLSLPVTIENTSIINAVFHAHESFDDAKNLLFIDFIGGIGAVQLFCGEVNRAFAGEIGHTTVDAGSDIKCVCGNRGCLEVMCSYERALKLAGADSFDVLIKRFEQGEPQAVSAVENCMEYLGIAVANLVDTMGPDMIILNGAEWFKCDKIYGLFVEKVKSRAYKKLMENTEFTLTCTDNQQALCGMALHLCESVFDISFESGLID